MIPELGQFALILAMCLALIQATFPLIGLWRNESSWMLLAKPAAIGQSLFIAVAFIVLAYAFLSNDFSVVFVAKNSNTHLPWIYRLAAVWGGHEGSLLLWVTILSFWTATVALVNEKDLAEIKTNALVILGLLNVGFLIFILSTSSPFARYLPTSPLEGADLNPLLQDPGLAIHPPMLYMGYVGFAVVFAFAIAALISGRVDASWARLVKPWVLAAWCFLTAGITLGSWWAYRVLGWGGWWFWDPVENAALLPWLTGTALIHALTMVEKRDELKTWTILLSICAFSLSLLGTFLVRSGILISVHAFAQDPARGRFLLEFLGLVIGGALILYAWRAPKLSQRGTFALLSRETFLLMNNVLLVIIMCTVLLGTLYPLILDTLGGEKISVGPPYFNTVVIPLMVPLLVAMGVGPLCSWQKIRASQLFKYLGLPLILVMAITFLMLLIKSWQVPVAVVLGIGLASWIIFATVQAVLIHKNLAKQWGMVFAHLGMAVCVIGITLTTHYKIERDVEMQVGDVVQVGNYEFKFMGVHNAIGPNYTGVNAVFEVAKNQRLINSLVPEKRIYNANQTPMTIAAIDAGLFRDLYVALGDSLPNNSWGVRIYYKPFIRWIWWGGFLMFFGGLIVLVKNVFHSGRHSRQHSNDKKSKLSSGNP